MPHPSAVTFRVLAVATAGLLTLALTACGDAEPDVVHPTSTQSPEPSQTPEPTPEPTETPEPTPEPTEEAEPVAEDIDGRWCPTPESPEGSACVTIALPDATYDDGTVVDITAHGTPTEADGGFTFSMADAPFGTFYPAGVPIPGGTPDYYAGSDLPDRDRIWEGQTGTMLVRESGLEITSANCSSITGVDALAEWGDELAPAPSGTWDLHDTMGWSGDTYDACATLSWIVVPLESCCRADYPFQIMLFHDGVFVQAATEEVYGRIPEVERLSDGEIRVTYSWVPDGGSITGPFDTAVSTFRWDDASGAVVRDGDLPPVHF